jgi:hypothetical protein
MGITIVPTLRNKSVQLVHKNNAGLAGNCPLKYLSYIFLAFTNVHVEQLGALYTDEAHFALFSDAFAQKGLACSRWPIEKEACSGFNPLIEYFWMFDGEKNSLYNLFLGCFESSHVVPADLDKILYFFLLHKF